MKTEIPSELLKPASIEKLTDALAFDYAVMAVCCAALFLAPFTLWRKLRSRVYGEESITVHIAANG